MKVEVRNGNVDKAIRVLKNKLQQEGVFNELREREYYMTKGEKRRRAKAAAIRRAKKAEEKRLKEFGFQKLEEHQNYSTTSTPNKEQDALSWWLKWISSIILIFAMVATTNDLYPWNMFLQAVGVLGWLWVSIIWNDRALIIVNAVAVAIFLNGIVNWTMEILEYAP